MRHRKFVGNFFFVKKSSLPRTIVVPEKKTGGRLVGRTIFFNHLFGFRRPVFDQFINPLSIDSICRDRQGGYTKELKWQHKIL